MRKRRYLYRLAMSIFGILLFPMILFIVIWGKYSYDKVEAANEEYQEAIMEYHMMKLDEMLIELREHAASVSVESKAKTSIFWEKDSKNNYWYYQAIQEMKSNYHFSYSSSFFIYYYEDDCIVSEYGKLSIENFYNSLGLKNLNQEQYLKDFFSEEKYEESMLCISGTENQAEGANRLFIGLYTNFGRQRDKVMLLYVYSEDV